MTPYRRNILVGMVMLGAMIILAWMIIQFGDAPARWLAPPTINVTIIAERADGIAEGSIINYRGVTVGRVVHMRRSDNQLGVIINAHIDDIPPRLPGNLVGVIRSQVLGGSGNLSLQLAGVAPVGELKNGEEIQAHFVGLDFLPPEFSELAGELRATAKQFRESNIVEHLDQQVNKVGSILDNVNTLVGDPKMREDIRDSIAQIHEASASAARLGTKLEQTTGQVSDTLTDVRGTISKTNTSIDTLSKQMTDRMQQVARSLDHLESITAKIDEGKGTAGALVNDPHLYQSLAETAKELNGTIADLKRLVEQWEQEGVSLKLK